MPSSPDITLLNTTGELEALLPEWHQLWLRDPAATPFQHPAWLLPWWDTFSQPHLHVACIRQRDQLTGLLPLYVYPASAEHQLLLLGAGTSDYLDGLFDPACPSTAIASALHQLARQHTWQTAHLAQLRPHSRLYQAIIAASPSGLRLWPGEPTSRCPALPVSALPKKVRAEVLYFRNAASARGALRLQLADETTCLPALERLIHLHSTSWHTRGESGVLADPAVLAWHREAVPQLQAAGALRLYNLLLDEEPIAALYALTDPPRQGPSDRPHRNLYTYLIGHSPAHAALKPGTLLTAMASEAAAAEGITTIDMLRGNETYKKFWHVTETPTHGLSFPRPA